MKKYFIVLFIGVILAVAVAVVLISKMESYLYNSEIEKVEQSHKYIQEKIADYIEAKDTFITMVSEYDAVRKMLYKNDVVSLNKTKTFFYNLVKGNDNIMQLRVLDASGCESVRVDRTEAGTIVQIKEKDLQNKSHRDYFKRFSKLARNEVGFSDIDLNVEYGKVEIPWRPTLRMGMPVFFNSKRVGTVIINYSVKHWLEDLSKMTNNNFYLIDPEGYFIMHPDDNWKWSRYQKPSKKASKYFGSLSELKTDFSDIKIIDNLFIKKLNFFNNQHMLCIYEPQIPIRDLLYEKSVQVSVFLLVILLLVLVPVSKLILVFIKRLHDEKEQLQYSQMYISKIFNNTFDAMFVINRVGIIQKVNLGALKLFDYTESELIGENINILMPEPEHSMHDSYLKAYKDDGHSIVIGVERELNAVDKHGKLIPISLSVNKMEQDGELLFIGSIRDHTQLRAAQNKQREQETMLLQQSKLAAMGEMLSAIAHQWRQPLNSVGLIVQDLVSAEKHGELSKEYLVTAKDNIMQQLHLMSDTIDEFRNFFLKTNTKKSFNVISAIEEIKRLYWAQFNAHDIEFEVFCQDESGEYKTCDFHSEESLKRFEIESLSNELKQVLLNIIGNAKDAIQNIEMSDEYQRKIIVCVESTQDEVIVKVRDHAGGMDETILNRIFEPYFTTKEIGTGLGLFIVKTLVEKQLRGTVECKNKDTTFEGRDYRGSVFSVTIPKFIDEYNNDSKIHDA